MAPTHHCDHSERVVVLETEVAALKETLKEILTTVKEIDDLFIFAATIQA